MVRERELVDPVNPWKRVSPQVVKAPMVTNKRRPRRALHAGPSVPPVRKKPLQHPVGKQWLQDFFRGKSIAVVGNSFDNNDIATEVDAHDVVVRFNLDEARLIYGYTQVRPQVPAGEKTTVMAAFWNRMSVPRILTNFPEIELLMSLRPDRGRMHANYVRSQIYDVDRPVFTVSRGWYRNIARKVEAPVLCGMVFMYVLLQANTASNISLYNFNFYTPDLNAHVDDMKAVYNRYLFGSKGNRYYGDRAGRQGHNLSKSYRWFKQVVSRTPNATWKITPQNQKKIEAFLL